MSLSWQESWQKSKPLLPTVASLLRDWVLTDRGFVPGRCGTVVGRSYRLVRETSRHGTVDGESPRLGTVDDANRHFQFYSWPLSSAVCISSHMSRSICTRKIKTWYFGKNMTNTRCGKRISTCLDASLYCCPVQLWPIVRSIFSPSYSHLDF